MSRWTWDKTKEQALALLFEGRKSLDQVALSCAIPSRTLDNWIAHPDFKERLEHMRANLAESLEHQAYIDKASRLVALSQMAESARQEYEARPWLKEVRQTGKGQSITNESFNEAAFASFRGALDDIAKELGARKNVTEVSGKDGSPIEFAAIAATLESKLADLAQRVRPPAISPGSDT